jgi:Asp-tRNA(Asn)/Glu-tRNA(Gln) amidotransferase A subunit family amidase
MLIGRTGEDRRLLSIAAAIERHVRPTQQTKRQPT